MELHNDLKSLTYQHGSYQAFKINDPKPRDIHKASVRDRLLHHAIYRVLYPFFDQIFFADSYSCRLNKGTHKAVDRFRELARRASKNDTKVCWILKCDVRKFFANIDHDILISILEEYIPDKNIIKLLHKVILSFSSQKDKNIGLPLGNLTSQLFVNIYLNKFDQFVKHKLRAKYYLRYADDFVIFSENKKWLENSIKVIKRFLLDKLKLRLHPDKIFIKTATSGVDWLGFINFPNYLVLRTKTKKRMFKKISANKEKLGSGLMDKATFNQSLQSYYGLLKHCRGYKLKQQIGKIINEA